ncbi:MAG: ABC transporter ATP-binding protein [Smithellaceae bacterium]|jgi:branched-chain amino acid transport system ATP-binding protein|nr:ABC transporter ATP-binding protein [Smithellaceae bacterium]
MMTKEPLLKITGVTKTFGGLVALDKVDMHVNQGEIVGLIGPNGAGKTTLFNVIAGAFLPEHGEICFQGQNVTHLKAHNVCKLGIARTFQVPKPFKNLTLLENMMVGTCFGAGLGKSKESLNKIEEILRFAGLEDKISSKADTLNLVERKKLEVSKALSTSPKLVLFDEVMAGLNPSETVEMITFIGKLRDRGLTILLIEHLMKVIMTLSDRVVVLDYGRKICEGKPHEVANNAQVIEAYLGKSNA